MPDRSDEGATVIEIVKLPEGESGKLSGNLTEDRREALAEYWGTPENERHERWGDPNSLAKVLGISSATVRRARTDPRVLKMVKDALSLKLVYDVVEARSVELKILRDEKEKGDTRLKAARTIEQMAGNLTTGPAVQVFNDNRHTTVENMSIEELRRELREINPDSLEGE